MNKYAEIKELFGIDDPIGYSAEEIEKAKSAVGGLPLELELFCLNYGKSPELHGLQDEFVFPGQYKALLNNDHIIFFNENQGICQAGIKKSDADLPDPPVYVRVNDGGWEVCCPHVSDFLIAMFGYQASICLEFSPEEFYFITEEEKEKIERLFKKREQTFVWFDFTVTLYGDNNSGRLALIDNGVDDIQMQYAANTEEEYLRIQELLDGIGEPM